MGLLVLLEDIGVGVDRARLATQPDGECERRGIGLRRNATADWTDGDGGRGAQAEGE